MVTSGEQKFRVQRLKAPARRQQPGQSSVRGSRCCGQPPTLACIWRTSALSLMASISSSTHFRMSGIAGGGLAL